ncbi:hypothetical protein TOPH_00534 [Tolypocladium ophioglossoides CBS 100239]|uniref:Calcineurin-like phosphoesterase domain-containing protein n=1 Tax=Tolypocladium ophioglossoides (strain CBS 100239) TaxID=1163406 RepID=A0A0L0NMC7_TOLOC|nr:hypothetical protein TOPH_00534 [Tolypocladium ophioglossoides CBS 100239]
MRRLVTRLFPSGKGPKDPKPAVSSQPVTPAAAVSPSPAPAPLPPPCISLQVMSDLHLEVGQQYAGFDFPVTAPYLVLAGDVGCLADYDAYLGFLRRQTERYTRVFLVLGNHEFYGLDFATGLRIAQKMEDEPSLGGKLCLLQQTRADIGGSSVTILGCTLWSSVPAEDRDIVTSKVADFRNIKDWIVEDHNNAHRSDLRWLKAELQTLRSELGSISEQAYHETGAVNAAPTERSVVVITHHAPLVQGTSRPEHLQNPWASAFATDVLTVGKWDLVESWIHGHTHYSCDFGAGGVRVVSNQRGCRLPALPPQMQDEEAKRDDAFDPTKVIRVPMK